VTARRGVRLAEALARRRACLAEALARRRACLAEALARRRVALGFVIGALVLWLAQPTWLTLGIGAAVAFVGEAIRLWAAGHVEKGREVTRSGPYQFTRHPLYLGSSIMAAGIVVASNSVTVGVLVLLYLSSTIIPAIRLEEAHLREKFGGDYEAYVSRSAAPMQRAFSAARARANREHHTIAGLLTALGLLALKVRLSLP
jgi:protein-S-isoprenylcysteine O-methyltransferase Ste14